MVERQTPSSGIPVAPLKPWPVPAAEPSPQFRDQPGRIATGVSEPNESPAAKPSSQNRQYTWRDGDRAMTVLLQPDLTVDQDGEIASRDDTATRTARGEASGKVGSEGPPVFRSLSGSLMTLPGGVLVALDKGWTEAETDVFFERNGIAPGRLSRLDYVANGFYVETDPGWASLELANSLAAQDGVRISSPNWRRELVAR